MARFRFANRTSFCATVILPVECFSSNGQQCLNCLSQLTGPPYGDSSKPLPCSLKDIVIAFDNLSRTNGFFIGFERGDGSAIQFVWNDPYLLTVDIPLLSQGGSLVINGSVEELRPLIEQFANAVLVESLPGFELKRF